MDAGNTAMFACVGYGTPDPDITWTRGGNQLTSDSSLFTIYEELVTEGRKTFAQSILKICSANLSDGGQYIFLATNLHGNDSATLPSTLFQVCVKPVISDFTRNNACIVLTVYT